MTDLTVYIKQINDKLGPDAAYKVLADGAERAWLTCGTALLVRMDLQSDGWVYLTFSEVCPPEIAAALTLLSVAHADTSINTESTFVARVIDPVPEEQRH